jgi:predicted amidophosphoribosyltransferase
VLRFGQNLNQVFVLYEFDDSVRTLVHVLKYRGKTLSGQILGEMLGDRISAAGLEGVVCRNALSRVRATSAKKTWMAHFA